MCSCDGGAVVVVEGVCGCDGGAVVVVEGVCVAVMVAQWLWWRGCVWL